jgi:hypothetical protein
MDMLYALEPKVDIWSVISSAFVATRVNLELRNIHRTILLRIP